jgi:hypothetical protein
MTSTGCRTRRGPGHQRRPRQPAGPTSRTPVCQEHEERHNSYAIDRQWAGAGLGRQARADGQGVPQQVATAVRRMRARKS